MILSAESRPSLARPGPGHLRIGAMARAYFVERIRTVLSHLDGDLEIRLSREPHLLELDPLVLGMGLGDVARSKDDAWCSFLVQRTGVGPEWDTHHLIGRGRSRVAIARKVGRASRRRGPTAAACAPKVGRTRASRARPSRSIERLRSCSRHESPHLHRVSSGGRSRSRTSRERR